MNKGFRARAVCVAVLLCAAIAWPDEKTPTLAEAKAEYEKVDRDLNQQYQQAKASLSERDFEALQQKQREWIRYRDGHSDQVVRRDMPKLADDGDLTQVAAYWQLMSEITKDRTPILRSIVAAHRGKAQPLGGRWSDGVGGYIDIVELDGRIAFDVEVVRGPTHHLGGIVGYATVNGKLAHFDDGGENDGKGNVRKAAWVTFVRRFDSLELLSANAEHYCGARAYFDGEYYRIADLSKVDRDRIVNAAKQDNKEKAEGAKK